MAKSARFDHDFLVGYTEKQKKWKKQGKRAGHGSEFNINAPLAELNRESSVVFDAPAPPAVVSTALLDTSGLPEWLIKIVQSDHEVARAATQKKVVLDSPYKQRLAYGVKHPDEVNDSKQAEHWLQVRIFYTLEREHPDFFPYVYAVPNGGYRTKKAASMMLYEGQMKGVQDIVVSFPRGAYHGMYLEVKTEKGVASPIQKEMKERFSGVGYHCVIEKGFESCMASLRAYFALPIFDGVSIINESIKKEVIV